MYVFNTGGDIGDISVGDITLNAHGTSAYVSAYLTTESDGAHDIGTITLGNVVMDVTGTSATRSEEHTSELQSLMRTSYAVFCLKKKPRPLVDESHNLHITTTSYTILI